MEKEREKELRESWNKGIVIHTTPNYQDNYYRQGQNNNSNFTQSFIFGKLSIIMVKLKKHLISYYLCQTKDFKYSTMQDLPYNLLDTKIYDVANLVAGISKGICK